MKRRMEFLDNLRGCAALLVLIGHFLDMYVKHNNSTIHFSGITSFVDTFELGRVGVIVFFLITGFVVPFSLQSKQGNNVIRHFLKRIVFRLYPAFWFSIFVALIVANGVGINIDSLEQIVANFTMIPKYLGYESVQGAYWTLHLLVVFYMGAAALYCLGYLKCLKVRSFVLIAFCLVAVFFAFLRFNYGVRVPIVMPLGLATMVLGSIMRSYIESEGINLKHLTILCCVYFLCLYLAQIMYYKEGWARWFFPYFFGVALFGAFIDKIRISNSFLNFFGKISYSCYLLHMLAIALVFNFMKNNAYSFTGIIYSFIFSFLLTILLSFLSIIFLKNSQGSFKKSCISISKVLYNYELYTLFKAYFYRSYKFKPTIIGLYA